MSRSTTHDPADRRDGRETIESVQPDTRNPERVRDTPYENIAFTYQKIEWVWVKGGIAAADDCHATSR